MEVKNGTYSFVQTFMSYMALKTQNNVWRPSGFGLLPLL
jgi:hypothetical protein